MFVDFFSSVCSGSGQDGQPLCQPLSTTTSSKGSGAVPAPAQAQFSRTRSPNSLAEASSLLALSQPVTFSSDPQGPTKTAVVARTPALEKTQGVGPASQLTEGGKQPESGAMECVAVVEEKKSSQPCASNEARTGRTPSLSAAEAMLMLTSDFGKVPDGAKDSIHMQEDTPSLQLSSEGRMSGFSSSDVPCERRNPTENAQEGTPLNDSETCHVSFDVEEAKDEVRPQSSVSQDSCHSSMLQVSGTALDKPVNVEHVTPLTLDTQQTAAEQSVTISKLLSPPESSPSVTDCPHQDICDGLEAVSSEEEPVESRIARDEDGSMKEPVDMVDGKEKNSVTDPDSGGVTHQYELQRKEVVAVGSLPDRPPASSLRLMCNGQMHRAATPPIRHNPAEESAEVHCGTNNPQVIESEVSSLQHSLPETEGPMAAPAQLLTPPLDRDQVFTCALPDEPKLPADTYPQSTHFKHHDSARKHRNYRHSSHKEYPSSKSNHRHSLSPVGQRRERDHSIIEKSVYHHTGSERSSSQRQADVKMSRDRSSSRDRVQDRLVSVHEGQDHHQSYHSHREGPNTKHRHHDGQWGSRHHEKYSQRNGHHQTQPARGERWRHSSTHSSGGRDASYGDGAGNSGYGHKRRHSSYAEHSSGDPVPKPKRTVS